MALNLKTWHENMILRTKWLPTFEWFGAFRQARWLYFLVSLIRQRTNLCIWLGTQGYIDNLYLPWPLKDGECSIFGSFLCDESTLSAIFIYFLLINTSIYIKIRWAYVCKICIWAFWKNPLPTPIPPLMDHCVIMVCSQCSIGQAIRGASVIGFSVCLCVYFSMCNIFF